MVFGSGAFKRSGPSFEEEAQVEPLADNKLPDTPTQRYNQLDDRDFSADDYINNYSDRRNYDPIEDNNYRNTEKTQPYDYRPKEYDTRDYNREEEDTDTFDDNDFFNNHFELDIDKLQIDPAAQKRYRDTEKEKDNTNRNVRMVSKRVNVSPKNESKKTKEDKKGTVYKFKFPKGIKID